MPSGSIGSVWAIRGSSRSALVNTPSTPGCREASSVSMPAIRACGYDERTYVTQAAPSRATSST
jgi:hypothetical protein